MTRQQQHTHTREKAGQPTTNESRNTNCVPQKKSRVINARFPPLPPIALHIALLPLALVVFFCLFVVWRRHEDTADGRRRRGGDMIDSIRDIYEQINISLMGRVTSRARAFQAEKSVDEKKRITTTARRERTNRKRNEKTKKKNNCVLGSVVWCLSSSN